MRSGIIVCCLSAAAGAEQAPSRNYLREPGFELGGREWQRVYPEAQANVVSLGLDRETKRSGEAAAFVSDAKGSEWAFHNWSQHLDEFSKGKWLELSAWLKLDEVRYTAQMALQCWDGEAKKTVGWASSADRQKILGTADWQRYAVRIFVPVPTTAVWVRLGLTGAGKVWLDDAAVTEVDGPLPLATLKLAPGANALHNPGFEEQGPGVLSHWLPYKYKDPEGKVAHARDTVIFRTGSASARIMNRNWTNREPHHWGQMVVPAPVGKLVRLTGYVRTESVQGEAGFLLQCYDGPMIMSPTLLAEVGTHQFQPASGDEEWTAVSAKLVVPANTMQLWVRAFLRGAGTAWFDDVRLTVE